MQLVENLSKRLNIAEKCLQGKTIKPSRRMPESERFATYSGRGEEDW
jgi:hypothetical protein